MLKLFKKMHSREWKMAGICALLIIGQIYFELRLPDYMSNLTVLIETPGSSMSEVYRTGAEMLACTLASAALSILCGYLVSRIAGGFSYTIRELVFKKVADFGQKEMHAFSVPSLINRTTNDITQIQMFVAMGLQIMVKAPVMAVWAVLKIINKSWTLSVITAGFVVALLCIMVLIIVIILPRVKRVQRMLDDINLVSRENLNGISVVHAYNAEDYQAEKFEKANNALTRTQLFNQRALAFLMPVVSFAMSALSLIIYWVGAAIINDVPLTDMTGRIAQFGDIVVFGTYATYVIMSIMMMVMIIMLLPSAQVSAGRINEVLDTEIGLCEGDRTEAKETGTVEFRNVSFQYPSAGKNTLENISFKVNKGETIAFIGATGSGKTTLVSLAASPIVQGGTNVSGGQKQRLSIARALARKPEILIFDDSFSALDYRTDAKLRKALNSKLKGTTCMIVAQRIGTIRNADKIVVLEDGKAAGIGTHEELMKTCKVYQEIAMSQLSKEELGA